MSEGFAAEVESLEKAAHFCLLPLAEELRAARSQVLGTAEFDLAFDTAHPESSSVFEGAGRAWAGARELLERVLDDNAVTLDLTAQALIEIARRYRETDEQIGHGLRGIELDGLS